MKTFKQYIFEKYTFGGTAFGLSTIDKQTALDQKAADEGNPKYKGFDQRIGSSGRPYIAGYSIASTSLPIGSIVKIIDKRTGEPVGKQFGNNEGIYRVDSTGGKQTRDNIDFYSGDNKEMYDYFASLGVNSNNLEVETVNILPNSVQEQELLSKLKKYQSGLPIEKSPEDIGGSALANLQNNIMNIMKGGMGQQQAQTALTSILNAVKGAVPAGTTLPF